MAPVLRTRGELNMIGEVRSDEADPAIRAANIGQGTLVTVHGSSAVAGLGQLISQSAETFNMPALFAGVTLLAAAGIAMTSGFSWLERRLLPWRD